MKKSMVLGAVLVSVLLMVSGDAFAGGAIKLGFDSGGSLDATASGGGTSRTYDVNTGASFALEGFGSIGNNLDLGGGIEFQSARGLDDYSSRGKFKFVPLYLMMRLHPEPSDITPYVTLQLGFSILSGDDAFTRSTTGTKLTAMPGGHLGIGVGYILEKHFLLEVLATLDTGGLTDSAGDPVVDFSYSKITFSIGYNF